MAHAEKFFDLPSSRGFDGDAVRQGSCKKSILSVRLALFYVTGRWSADTSNDNPDQSNASRQEKSAASISRGLRFRGLAVRWQLYEMALWAEDHAQIEQKWQTVKEGINSGCLTRDHTSRAGETRYLSPWHLPLFGPNQILSDND